MPVAQHPRKRDYFVYTFWVECRPFYVGIGRLARASDRIRYVRSLMKPHNKEKLARKSLSVRVMALMLQRGLVIKQTQTRCPMNRTQALARESAMIARYVRAGFQLTNWQQNPNRMTDAHAALRAILRPSR